MSTFLQACAALCLCAGAVLTQDPVDPPTIDRVLAERLLPEVTTRLGAKEAATVAWGGYLAQRFGLQEAVGDLRKTLVVWQDTKGREADFVRLALLDALLRLDADVPANELTPHLRGRASTPALLLLARRPALNAAALLEYFDILSGYHEDRIAHPDWLATGHLLAANKSHGFAASLIRQLDFHLLVCVREPGNNSGREMPLPGSTISGLSCGSCDVLNGFPPVAWYELTTSGSSGMLLVAAGEPSVFALRTEHRHQFNYSSPLEKSASEARWSWFKSLVDPEPLAQERAADVRFHSATEFLREVAYVRELFQQDFRAGLAQLVKSGALTKVEADAAVFQPEVSVSDLRVGPREALPTIPNAKQK